MAKTCDSNPMSGSNRHHVMIKGCLVGGVVSFLMQIATRFSSADAEGLGFMVLSYCKVGQGFVK